MYGSYCSKGILDCKSLVGQMYCMRSCGKCAHIDQMFVCKDERPEFCGMINCANPLGIQFKISIPNSHGDMDGSEYLSGPWKMSGLERKLTSTGILLKVDGRRFLTQVSAQL